MNLPKARTSDLIEQEADKELLIYDLRTNKMFQLNETSKIVYRACGKMSFDELKHRHQFTDDFVHLALAELYASNLIEGEMTNHFAGMNRREVIRKVGFASMVALPVISSLIAPSPAQAASAFAPGSRNVNESCNTSTDCEQVSARNCVAVRGQSSTGRACCVVDGSNPPVFLPGGDPNGGTSTNYISQVACENAVSGQCCSRLATCNCTQNSNGTASCRSVCR